MRQDSSFQAHYFMIQNTSVDLCSRFMVSPFWRASWLCRAVFDPPRDFRLAFGPAAEGGV